MVIPGSSSWFTTKPERSLAPSENAMRKVYDAFKAHNINLHIDAGSSSTDFVTGREWGGLSRGGDIVPHKSKLDLSDNYDQWNEILRFDGSRQRVFRYAIFCDRVFTSKEIGGFAGTFMHELGHTIGLRHGGSDSTHYKPNYLSVMNYLFQLSGLVGTNSLDYSNYILPDLNEDYLIEVNGIDPAGLTEGTGLGTKLNNGVLWAFDRTVVPISKTPVDYNNLWGIDKDPVSVELNYDDNTPGKTVLTSYNDWDNIIFKAGDIGTRQTVNIAGLVDPPADEKVDTEELPLEEFLEKGLMGNIGAGKVEGVGPFTILAERPGQKFYLRISNLSTSNAACRISVDANELVSAYATPISVEGSTEKINFTDVPIPLISNPQAGNYSFNVRLTYPGREDVVVNIPVNVYDPSDEELSELKKLIDDGELDDILPEEAVKLCSDIIDGNSSSIYTITATANTGGSVCL